MKKSNIVITLTEWTEDSFIIKIDCAGPKKKLTFEDHGIPKHEVEKEVKSAIGFMVEECLKMNHDAS